MEKYEVLKMEVVEFETKDVLCDMGSEEGI